MQPTDLTKALNGYSGKWVILSSDNKKVLLSAKTIESLLEMGKEKKIKDGILMKVPKTYHSFIGA